MTTGTVSRCRSCSAPIVWTVSATKGKPMPMNAEPDPNGEFILLRRGRDIVAYHRSDARLEREQRDGLRFTSHYATCPSASLWRKAKR